MAKNKIPAKQAKAAAKIQKREAKTLAKSQKKEAQSLAKASNQQRTIVDYGQHQNPDWRHSTNDQVVRYTRFRPEQQELINQLYPLIQQSLGNLPLPGGNSFENIRNKANYNFQTRTIPSIAERFQALAGPNGHPGALSSSPLYQMLQDAGVDLNQQLADLEARHEGQTSSNLLALLSGSLAPQFDYGVIPGQDSGLRKGWDYAKGAIPGAIIGGLTGGLPGAAAGALSGLGAGNVVNAYNQRQAGLQVPQQSQSHAIGFNSVNSPISAISQGYQQAVAPQSGYPLGIYDINNSIAQGYRNNLTNF